MNLQEIYNTLLAGDTIEMPFLSKEDAEVFRVALSKYKSRQDKIMLGIGMLEEEEIKVCSFILQASLPLEGRTMWEASIKFRPRKPEREYIVKIIRESDVTTT